MTAKVSIASVLKTVAKISILKGGALKEADRAYVMKGGVLRQFYEKPALPPTPPPDPSPDPPPDPPPTPVPGLSLTVVINPSAVSGSATTSSAAVITSNPATAVASNGVAPYQYVWSLVSSDSDFSTSVPTINSPNSATTTFTKAFTKLATYMSATLMCTVRDANNNTGSAQVGLTMYKDSSDTNNNIDR